jgi:NAD(P)H-hydrate epimerase
MRQRFQKSRGTIHPFSQYQPAGVILDGLVGTGFKGKAEGVLAQAIEETNAANLPILSIDIPSGLNGTSGAVESVAIRATQTLYLELPKIGFFINQGWDHVGTLVKAEFGLGHMYREKAEATAHLLDPSNVVLPNIKRTRHKYEVGYVLACAGSKEMPGAAILASYAALLAGAGIVRLFHFKHMAAELSSAPVELIKEEWDGKSVRRIHAESARAKALLIGPGIGRSKAAQAAIKKVLTCCTLPTVIDADALYFLSEHPKWDLHPQSILTPHRGEMHMLLSSFRMQGRDPIQSYVDHKKTTLVLKGAPTFIFHENALPIIVARGDPGMAAAGAGDVLTGMIAAMLAQGLDPRSAACTAVTLHALAGEIGARLLTSYCLTASKILEFIPDAFLEVRD